jgi:transposase
VDDGERTTDGLPAAVIRHNGEEGVAVATPAQVDVWVGLDDQADLEALLERAGRHGTPGLVTGQPGSIAQLALAVAARHGTPVAYVPGLVMRRAADLYPGEAKTDRRDAYVLADTGRTRRKQVHWLDAG